MTVVRGTADDVRVHGLVHGLVHGHLPMESAAW
jgi:hypothetical protein